MITVNPYLIHYPADTTGLQSSAAVLELNGSITITCTFAPGASSTGCQVTILMEGLQVFSTIIIRSQRVNQVNFKCIDLPS